MRGGRSVTDLLAVRDLNVCYHTHQGIVQTLDGVSLSIAPGEVVGLVGESGCGKSTLAKAILNVLPQPAARVREGEIVFAGHNLLHDRAEAARIKGRRITIVPQDPFGSFNPLFTIGHQMLDVMQWKSPRANPTPSRFFPALFARYPGERRARDLNSILEMLEAVQIPNGKDVLKKLPHELSGGQRQRIMIALALLPEPDLIIADEPTTALDVTVQAQILRLLVREVRRRGVAVLFTTHDLGTAYEICDRIVVMYAGQEVEAASNADFFANPRHPYTAKLLDSVPRPNSPLKDIPGSIPGLINPPSGCRFRTRCDRATEICSAERPAPAGDKHVVRCHHPIGSAI